jgi:hypothetical protein
MYRDGGKPPERGRAELEDMAREGRLRREVRDLRQQDEAAKKQRELEALARGQDDAFAHRFVMRASPAFRFWSTAQLIPALVAGGVVTVALSMSSDSSLLLGIGLGTATIFVVLAAGALVMRAWRRAVLAREREWAREKAYDLVGLVKAVGAPRNNSESVVHLIVDLERELDDRELSLVRDAIEAVSSGCKVQRENQQLAVHSGSLRETALAPWCHRVVGRLLPTLEDHGILRVELRGRDTFEADWDTD